MQIGRLYTIPIQDHGDGAIGQFELEVTIDTQLFLQSGDKGSLIRRQIATYAATAAMDTQVPLEYWRFSTSSKIAKELNLPATFSFGVHE